MSVYIQGTVSVLYRVHYMYIGCRGSVKGGLGRVRWTQPERFWPTNILLPSRSVCHL